MGLALGAVLMLPTAASAADGCADLLIAASPTSSRGAVTPEVLAALRDIGPVHHSQGPRPVLAVSPDQAMVAFAVHRAVPTENRYCTGLVVLPLAPGAKPWLVDVGGELILDRPPGRGWASFESGTPMPITPRWDSRGRWLAFLKRIGGSTQVWRAGLDGRRAQQVTRAAVDVDDFRIGLDERSVIIATRPGLVQARAALAREGLSGWRYDARWVPARAGRPLPLNVGTVYTAVDLATGSERPATHSEAALFAGRDDAPGGVSVSASAPNGERAWISSVAGSGYPPRLRLYVRTASGAREICKSEGCAPDGSTRLWWTRDGGKLRFSRREGWAGSVTAIYEWSERRAEPRRVYATRDSLIECQARNDDLLCLREASREPRQVVLLGLGGRREHILFRSNPQWSALALGRVERREWLNEAGLPFFGDLVYPVGYRRGERYPLVVVQYRTRGFLRGGVGDEMPIQAFAGRGYFVLVFDIGDEAAIVGPQPSEIAQQAAYYHDLAGVKQVASGLEAQLRELIRTGLIDGQRIGLHGLSAGSRTVQYAALNSRLFAAGSIVGCCWEPDQDAFLGAAIAEGYHVRGWPRMADPAPQFWSQISLMTQPSRVRFPILIQAADSEYLPALGSVTALTQAKVPVDLFVFPDEYHIKWQPTHRLAAYRRNLAWFDFWLKDRLPAEPDLLVEATRWRFMGKQWARPSPAAR